jgi:hypothetical protein
MFCSLKSLRHPARTPAIRMYRALGTRTDSRNLFSGRFDASAATARRPVRCLPPKYKDSAQFMCRHQFVVIEDQEGRNDTRE